MSNRIHGDTIAYPLFLFKTRCGFLGRKVFLMVHYGYMKGFAFTLTTVIIIIALGYGGYFAVTSLKDPKSYVPKNTEKIGDLHAIITNPEIPETGNSNAAAPQVPPPTTTTTPSTTSSTVAPDSLTSHLKELATAKTVLKKGSKGVSVGYIQQFMNRYFKKTSKIDNDFGVTLESNVKKFQSQNKISQTGQVGASTLQMMIMWLEKNPK